jgi:hypothetical protein
MKRQEKKLRMKRILSLSHSIFFLNCLLGGTADELVVGLGCILVGKRPNNNI